VVPDATGHCAAAATGGKGRDRNRAGQVDDDQFGSLRCCIHGWIKKGVRSAAGWRRWAMRFTQNVGVDRRLSIGDKGRGGELKGERKVERSGGVTSAGRVRSTIILNLGWS